MYISENGYQLLRAKLDGLTLDCQRGAGAGNRDSAVRQIIVIGNRIEDVKKDLDREVCIDGPPDGAA